MENNKTFYAPTMGVADFRREISAFEKQLNGVDYDENEIMITTGSTEAIMSALFAVVNEGDEVIVPVPAFSMYKPVIELCKGRYVELNTAPDNFQITEKALASVVSDKTKAIILTSPNNPTGTILDEKSLLNVYEQVKKRDMFVICDECYNQLVYNERRPGFVRFQDLREKNRVLPELFQALRNDGVETGLHDGKQGIHRAGVQGAPVYDSVRKHLYTVCGNRSAQIRPRTLCRGIQKKDATTATTDSWQWDLTWLSPKAPLHHAQYKQIRYEQHGILHAPCQGMQGCGHTGVCFSAEGYMRIGYCVSMDTIVKALDRLEKICCRLGKKVCLNQKRIVLKTNLTKGRSRSFALFPR